MVCALSAAEMPVVTPFFASMDTVKAVLNGDVLFETMGDSRNWSHFWAVKVRQIKPRPYFAMKLIASGVTSSAAMVRSPSFSRSSSSTRITILPRFISSIAASIFAIGIVFWNLDPKGKCAK
jgi:hypothetical protein